MGKLEDWEVAESQLKNALDKFGKEYKINEGDGAFYGPKIDFKLFDFLEDNINAEPANLTFNFQSDLTSNTEPNKLKKKRMNNKIKTKRRKKRSN